MKQCERGHFFDDVRYQECPYCDRVQPTYGSTISASKEIKDPTAAPADPTAASVTSTTAAPADPMAASVTSTTAPAATPLTSTTAPATARTTTVTPFSMPAAPSLEPQEIGATVGVFSSAVGIDPPVAFVVVIEGPDKGASFTLRAGRSFIGRGSGSDIELSGDEAVSREGHALISYDARKNSFLAASGQGRQITYLNGEELVDPKPIKAYDIIEVGRSKLSFLPFCGEAFSWGTQ